MTDINGLPNKSTPDDTDNLVVQQADGQGFKLSIANLLAATRADISALQAQFNSYIPLSDKGVAGGVATLDSNGKIPAEQLPSGGGGGNPPSVLPKASLKFNGNFTDDTGFNTWSAFGGAATSGDQYHEGSQSLLLDSPSKYLQSAWSTNLNFALDFTWDCWIYPTTTSGTNRVILANTVGGTSGNAGMFVAIDNGSVIFRHWVSGASNASVSGIRANTWQRITAVKHDTILSLYLNGVKGVDGSTALSTPNNPFSIGIVPSNGGYAANFEGYIDSIELYDEAITP